MDQKTIYAINFKFIYCVRLAGHFFFFFLTVATTHTSTHTFQKKS